MNEKLAREHTSRALVLIDEAARLLRGPDWPTEEAWDLVESNLQVALDSAEQAFHLRKAHTPPPSQAFWDEMKTALEGQYQYRFPIR